MAVEPGARRNLLQLAVGRRHFDLGQPGVDAGARPRLAARQEKIGAARGVADEVVELDALLGQVVVRVGHAGLEPGRQRGGDSLAALVGEVAVALHRRGERVLDLLRGNPLARHHGAEHEGGLVERLVAAAGRHGGELGGDPAQRALGIGVLARTGRTAAAWPSAGAALLRWLDQVDDAGRHFRNGFGGERGSQVGLARNRRVGAPLPSTAPGAIDETAGAANVDARRQAAAAVGERRPALLKVNVHAVAWRPHHRQRFGVEAGLLLQQLAQRRDAVDAWVVPIAVEHHQAAARQVERRHGARPLRPPGGNGGGVVGAERLPALEQRCPFLRIAGKHDQPRGGQPGSTIAVGRVGCHG